MVPLLGTPSRVSEVLRGKKQLSMAMVQRLRARIRVPATFSFRRPPRRGAVRSGRQPDAQCLRRPAGAPARLWPRPGRSVVAPRRSSSAHLHRPWRAKFHHTEQNCEPRSSARVARARQAPAPGPGQAMAFKSLSRTSSGKPSSRRRSCARSCRTVSSVGAGIFTSNCSESRGCAADTASSVTAPGPPRSTSSSSKTACPETAFAI